jgi:hypothetical protein
VSVCDDQRVTGQRSDAQPEFHADQPALISVAAALQLRAGNADTLISQGMISVAGQLDGERPGAR